MTKPMTKILRRTKRYDRLLPISVLAMDGEQMKSLKQVISKK